ncbi:transcription termination factor MTEF1, chloroplastic [Amborella trichopoda]|nr:transcription termination factor MTEF1, chloroplastic [Amborella trichopoda]|eukprot:XP_006836347.2 transcription termination factor MTEF1, chloroplastic [Amborella trichopoda]
MPPALHFLSSMLTQSSFHRALSLSSKLTNHSSEMSSKLHLSDPPKALQSIKKISENNSKLGTQISLNISEKPLQHSEKTHPKKPTLQSQIQSNLDGETCNLDGQIPTKNHEKTQLKQPILEDQFPFEINEEELQIPPHLDQEIPDKFKEMILCLEIMGIDSGRALSLNPSLHSTSLDSINRILSYLQTKGIHQKDIPRIIGMCPKILTSSIENDLKPVFLFLEDEMGVPHKSFRKPITKCPRLLVSSVRDQLKPALFYLEKLGFMEREALAFQDPILLVSSVENILIPKLEFIQILGFSYEEAVQMVLRCPALFTFSIENNFKPKFGYYIDEMRENLEELKEFPQYFAFSLEKRIKPRHEEMVRSGVRLPLSTMLKSTDEEFRELIKGRSPVSGG